jgi:hypothetical protein
MTLRGLYDACNGHGQGASSAGALRLCRQTHWFTVNADFDPRTGETLPQSLSVFLSKIAQQETGKILQDRLWRITEHARASVEHLFRALNESPRREQALLPIHAVRELDANSFIKLSNRPGRNIREKLAGRPYLQAVRRFQSVDIPENRLLKAFVIRLSELLELRHDCLGEEEDEILPKIRNWLLADEAQSIAGWDNLPPNNTLLSHRDYRRIWDAWRRLQTLDEDITNDLSNIEERAKTMDLWIKYGKMYSDGKHLFADMPVFFNYDKFEIRPWLSPLLFREIPNKISRSPAVKKINTPVCIDLTAPHPCCAVPDYNYLQVLEQVLEETFIWQQWKRGGESVDIELFTSDAACLHPDATTISSVGLFFSKDNTLEHLDRAAKTFTEKLREIFGNTTFIWLVPDFLNDWEIEITRRNINACFPQAEPLPRSVAAVFEQVDYSKIKNSGFSVVVVDSIGGKICATKLIARIDEGLKERLPETNGYYWERCPPVIISDRETEDAETKKYEIITVDTEGNWHNKETADAHEFVDPNTLKTNKSVGQFAFCINLKTSPVAGGIRLHGLQQRSAGIPLWRDHIPELSIKARVAGIYKRFCLVGKTVTIRPLRGAAVPIEIPESFTLPAGKPFYQFPLYQGENDEELGFSARLDSPAFPLKEDTVYKLNLTFEYGADEPYKLIFIPLDKSFPPVRAAWRRAEEAAITDAPAPEYPKPLSWDELRHWIDIQKHEIDLLAWLADSLTRLNELIPSPSRYALTLSSHWRQKNDKNGKKYWFTFAASELGQCYCNSKCLIDSFGENPNESFPAGTKLFGNIKSKPDGRMEASDISATEDIDISRLISFRKKSLQNRMSLIWSDNRSLCDMDVPSEFKHRFNELISLLLRRLPKEILMKKFYFLLACMHKDAPEECVQWIAEQVETNPIQDPQLIGFSLGDISREWQQNLFKKLVSKPDFSSIRVFAYAVWREEHFVEKFSLPELQSILNELNTQLSRIRPCPPKKSETDKWTIRNWARTIAEPLELLLGLLRTRASSDPEIKMLLQPRQKITRELAKQVERVTGIVVQSNVIIFSRVRLINIEKPEGDRTPDLLYALRLYLTGDDGANAICITGVSDNETEQGDE